MGLFDFLKKDQQDSDGQSSQTDDTNQSNQSTTLPPLPQSGFKDLTYPLPNTNIQPTNQNTPAPANPNIENYTFNSNQFIGQKQGTDPMDMMSGAPVLNEIPTPTTELPQISEPVIPIPAVIPEQKTEVDTNAFTTTDTDGIKVTTYQEQSSEPIQPPQISDIPGATIMQMTPEPAIETPIVPVENVEPVVSAQPEVQSFETNTSTPMVEIGTNPPMDQPVVLEPIVDNSLPEVSIGTDNVVQNTELQTQPVQSENIAVENLAPVELNTNELSIGNAIQDQPIIETSPIVPVQENDDISETMPTVENFTQTNLNNNIRIGLLGTNTTLNQNINNQITNLAKNAKGSLIIDSNKGYSVNIIDIVSRSNPDLKVVGSYFKSLYSELSDEAGISIPLKNYEAFIYSDITQKIKKIFESSDVLIYIESNGIVNMLTLVNLLAISDIYKEKLKPIILVGENLENKISQMLQQFGMTWQSKSNFKFVNPSEDLSSVINSVSSTSISNKVVDMRSGIEESGYLQ